MKQQLVEDYAYEFCSRTEVNEVYRRLHSEVFPAGHADAARDFMTEFEIEKRKELGAAFKDILRYGILVYQGEEVVGWSFGLQKSHEDHYMVNTGILPNHQGKGIYSRLLPVIIEHLKGQGVQRILSHHHLHNNQVIVPKLKAGFVITGIEVDAHFGAIVTLSYYTNPIRRKDLEARIWSEL